MIRRYALAAAAGLATATLGFVPAHATTSTEAAGTTQPAHPKYPVVYNITSARAGQPDAPPAGANIWTCKPSAAHPYPVVLVHGLGATMGENWGTMSPLLADNGYCVFALTYGASPNDPYVGGVEPMEQSSAQLASFVNQVLAATHAKKVDLVGHSEGTVMPQYYLKFRGGAAKVAKYVAIAPLYQGTTLDGLGTLDTQLAGENPAAAADFAELFGLECGSCLEFVKGSAFLTHLYANGVYAVAGVQYTTIMSEHDELVTPYTSGYLHAKNATNIVVQNQCSQDFSEHVSLAFDPVVGQDILNALDPAHPGPVPCTLVLPGYGATNYPG
jgi:pimeloyl-ACP methyl ester carboxylesterase